MAATGLIAHKGDDTLVVFESLARVFGRDEILSEEQCNPVAAEKRLACAVFMQAIDDLGKEEFRADAFRFLTSGAADWKDSREAWASLANIEADVIRDAVLKDESGLLERARKINTRSEHSKLSKP